MVMRPIVFSLIAALGSLVSQLPAQNPVTLRSADTRIELEAGPHGPRVASLQAMGKPAWTGEDGDPLIDHVEVDGRSLPIQWKLNPAAGIREDKKVVFVYECASPKLRLTWKWQVRASNGPIEHQVSLDNLSGSELWIPLQQSLRLGWHFDSGQKLRQFYVEKGADTPSAEGAHRVLVGDGYQWGGYSSTYAHPHEKEPREIIPWFLVERPESRDGWYLGIEFSGRTALTLTRNLDKIHATAGLNPEPGGAFRTRLRAGESFDA